MVPIWPRDRQISRRNSASPDIPRAFGRHFRGVAAGRTGAGRDSRRSDRETKREGRRWCSRSAPRRWMPRRGVVGARTPGSRHCCRVGKRRQLRCKGRRSAQHAATTPVVSSQRLRPALRTSVHRKSQRHCAAHQSADTTPIARPPLDAETCLSARGARRHRRNTATALRRSSTGFWDVPRVAARRPAHCFPQRCFHCRGSLHVQPCASVFDQGRYGAERSTRGAVARVTR